jgi:site-specific DNA recombinase
VDPEVFDVVQSILDGRKPCKPTRNLDHPDFPLRRVVACGVCLTPMTASWSTARNGSKYAYYKCRAAGCGVHVGLETFHASFETLLGRHVVRQEVSSLLSAVVEDAWEERRRAAQIAERALARRLSDLQAKEDRLVDKYVQSGSVNDDLFQRQLERLEVERSEVLAQIHEAHPLEVDLKETLAFARSLLSNLPSIWNRLDWKEKPQFVRALYPTALVFENGAIGTTQIPWLLKVFPTVPDDLSALAPLSPIAKVA